MTGAAASEAGESRPPPSAHRFSIILLATSVALCAAAWAWGGIDIALGVILGCLVVGSNYIWTNWVLRRSLLARDLKARVLLAYVFKFGLTLAVLYVAIRHLRMDPVAILVGVSSLLPASLILVLTRWVAR